MNGSPALEGWLNNATIGMSEEAKAYIRKQFLLRYEEAYQVELINGFSPEQAQNAAVLQFGSPLQANKKFKRKFLSTRQIKFLRQCLYLDTDWRMKTLLFSLWCILFFMFVFTIEQANVMVPKWLAYSFYLLVMAVSSYMIFIQLPRLKQNNVPLSRYIWFSIAGYDLAFFSLFSFFMITHEMLFMGLIMMLSSFLNFTISKIFILNKLHIEQSYLDYI